MNYVFVQWYRAWLIDARQTGENVFPADKEDYLVVKSRGRISFMNKQGKMDSKLCSLYIHFKSECIKEYAWRILDVHYKAFPFSEITFGKRHLPDYQGK